MTQLSQSQFQQSEEMWNRAREVLVAGVGDPSHFSSPFPFYSDHAEAQFLFDVDGNRYLDMNCAHSSLLMGHRHPAVYAAVLEQATKGNYLRGPVNRVIELATLMCQRYPSFDKVALTDSGSKACASAVRLARLHTGRVKIAKFIGGYHGTWEAVMAGLPNRYTNGRQESAKQLGIAPASLQDTVLLPFNETEQSIAILDQHGDSLAAIMVEPMIGDGALGPVPGFLESLRTWCTEHGTVLIFDEMVTLTAGLSGAQGIYGVFPDLTTCGKAIGGGLPIGGIGGTDEVMAHLDPRQSEIPVTSIFGASFGGHPFSLAAGLAQLQLLSADVFTHMDALADRLRQGVSEVAADLAIPLSATGVGRFSMLHWNERPVVTHADHARCDHRKLATICGQLRTSGFVGSGERFQTSFPMTEADIDDYLTTLSQICKSL